MKSFTQIFSQENMKMPDDYKVVQNFHTNLSVEFELTDSSRKFLKKQLKLTGNIYEPTLKKIAENIIIMNRKKLIPV